MAGKAYLLKTSRVGLREWLERDAAPFAEMNSDPDVMRYFPRTLTTAETESFVGRIVAHFADTGFGLYAVDELASRAFIGFIGFQTATFESDFTPCIEIGWRLARRHWGKGYATEGAAGCLRWGFAELGLAEVCSFTARINAASISVMKKIGLRHRRDFKHPEIDPAHALADHVLYCITKKEYEPMAGIRTTPSSSGMPSGQPGPEASARIARTDRSREHLTAHTENRCIRCGTFMDLVDDHAARGRRLIEVHGPPMGYDQKHRSGLRHDLDDDLAVRAVGGSEVELDRPGGAFCRDAGRDSPVAPFVQRTASGLEGERRNLDAFHSGIHGGEVCGDCLKLSERLRGVYFAEALLKLAHRQTPVGGSVAQVLRGRVTVGVCSPARRQRMIL